MLIIIRHHRPISKIKIHFDATGAAPIFAIRFGGLAQLARASRKYSGRSLVRKLFCSLKIYGGLAQLARALAWHVRGHRFDPDTLH